MEWWKLFSGTFILIFLAELGDKTQLAAMAKTADSPGSSAAKWVVFLGASLALVASTAIAVFAGHLLKRVVPDERYIRLAAAALFLIFGALMAREVWASFYGPEKKAEARAEGSVGVGGGLVLWGAMDLEAFVVERYRRLAAGAGPELGGVLMDMAREEEGHLSSLRKLVKGQVEPAPAAVATEGAAAVPEAPEEEDLLALAAHEEATAEFYAGLAAKTVLPGAASVLYRLAAEEQGHADRLRAFTGSRRLRTEEGRA